MTSRTSHVTSKRAGTDRRILGVVTAAVVALALIAVAGWAYLTRPQGQPESVEFSAVRLSPAMTGARVLALGEATHGNAEYQQMRTLLVSKAAGHGFHTVVVEEDYGLTREVDAFVQGGPGTATEAAQRFGFRINKTREVAEWLQWMRDHNASVPVAARIHLVGMDAQRTAGSLRLVSAALADSAPEVAARATQEGDALTADTVARVEAAVAALPAAQRRDAERAATALGQYVAMQKAGTGYGVVRDNAMFTNLRSIVEEADGGVVVIAHDGHVAKQPTGALTESVGHLAAQEWGEKYQAIGTDFHRTRFLSGNGTDRSEWALTNRTPLRGMYEGTRMGYVEIARTSGENRALFDRIQPMGSAGEGFTQVTKLLPFLHTVYAVPSELYDAVVLVDDATPVTML